MRLCVFTLALCVNFGFVAICVKPQTLAIGQSVALANQKTDPIPTPVPAPTAPFIKFPTGGFSGEIGDFIEIQAQTNCKNLKWIALKNAAGLRLKGLPGRLVPDPALVIVSSPKAGIFQLEVYGSTADGQLSDKVTVPVTIIDPEVPPPGPEPTPGPTPGPAPIPADGFRVLMVYESADLSKMPAAQESVLMDSSVRSYLNSKCVPGTDGKTKEWRIWDQNVDTTNEVKLWQDAMKRPRQSLPWIVISNGKSGFEGSLPGNVADTLSLLKKFGGN